MVASLWKFLESFRNLLRREFFLKIWKSSDQKGGGLDNSVILWIQFKPFSWLLLCKTLKVLRKFSRKDQTIWSLHGPMGQTFLMPAPSWKCFQTFFVFENHEKFWKSSEAVLHYMSQYYFCWDSVGMDILDLESVGMDPNCRAQHRASTSPPPPLAHFKHIELSVPKIKMESEMPNAKNQTLFC